MSEELYSRILGCMVGNALGDAFGGVVEGASAERVAAIAGGDWVDEFLPYPADAGPHPLGIWESSPPRGTGTDDTRYNQIFAECVIRNRGAINSQLLAMEYIERYRDCATLYPKHVELAEEQFLDRWYEWCCAHLGMDPPSGRPPWVALSQGVYGLPGIQGLISLAFAGLLYENEPEKAYVTAFELDFRGVGCSRDATAMMAAMVSAALGGTISAKEMVRIGLETDPFGLGKRKYDRRVMSSEVSDLLAVAEEAGHDRALVQALSRRMCHRHFYDPVDVLGFPMAALHFCNGDAIRTIVMAVNDREFDENGGFVRLRDVDCTGSVAGALVGALNGAQAFPKDWVDDVISANKQVYGIDIEGNARRFYEAVYGAK